LGKLLASLRKEFLVLVRDLPGLALLFLMPILLIVVVTLAQQNALRTSRENKTDILFLDLSNSDFTKSLQENLDSSGLFSPVRSYKSIQLDSGSFNELVSEGDYPAGILISAHDTAITLLLDPGLQSSYRQSLVASLTYLIKGTQSRIAIEQMLKAMAPGMDSAISSMITTTIRGMTPVKESYASQDEIKVQPSIIQNNVPGFILFAMFFIVITLSGSMVTDKNEGSFLRLRTLPVSVLTILSGKVLIYLGVCLLQFILMLAAGCWFLPVVFGLPYLETGHHYVAIAVATVAAALAATGFGLAVGAASKTHGQAALFGSVTVVILGVISGTFLPVNLMPKFLQYVSLGSPIRWGIDNYLDIFIRQGTILTILPGILVLLLFFILSLIFSIAIFAKRY
jgi:ABC-2 type transport system permease protein